jgi:hypothetical protein
MAAVHRRDCEEDASVSVHELLAGVTISLRQEPIDSCTAFDTNDSGDVEVDELINP